MPKRNGHGIELLADPTRRAIIVELAAAAAKSPNGLYASKIAKAIGRSNPATSRQLRLLREADLISVRKGWRDGRQRQYFISPHQLGRITAWLAGAEVVRVWPPNW